MFLATLITLFFFKSHVQAASSSGCPQFLNLTDSSGEITYFNYADNANCTWLIAGEEGSIIKLDLVSFSTECGYDYLHVLDSSRRAALCGNRTNELSETKIVSTSNHLYLRFVSDSYISSSGFNITYQILPKGKHCSSDKVSCNGGGDCTDGTCICYDGFHGSLCESQSSTLLNYTARELHAVAYEPQNDIMIMSFGRDWTNSDPLNDAFLYYFQNKSWISLTIPGDMQARYNHKQWFLDQNTMVLYGGQSNLRMAFSDIWIFNVSAKNWTLISIDGPHLFETASVLVPGHNGTFQVYLFGGLDYSQSCSYQLYRFSSSTKTWVDLGAGPVCYQRGTGVYNPLSNSIRFFGGFPIDDYSIESYSYTFEYNIESDWWTFSSPRNSTTALFGAKSVFDLSEEIAIIHGGLNVGGTNDCYLKTISILDLACNTWKFIDLSINSNRYNHGIVYRNHSLWVIGGNNGFLLNDMLEIPLSSSISLESQQNRDLCRTKSYCSYIDDCDSCNENTLCTWCNNACAYDQDKSPLKSHVNSTTTSKSYLMGKLDNGLCPLSSEPISTCPMDIVLPKQTLFPGNVTFQNYVDFYIYLGNIYGDYSCTVSLFNLSMNVTLISSFPDQQPFTSYSISSFLFSGLIPLRPVNSNYTRVRVSWGNDAGLRLNNDAQIPLIDNNTSFSGKEVSFLIYADTNYIPNTTHWEGPVEYSFWEYMQIGLAMLGVFAMTSVLLVLKRYIDLRRRQREALRNGNNLLIPIIRPIPQLHKYSLEIESNSSTIYPVSTEEFQASISPNETLTATTLVILMPNQQQSYLNQGLFPPFMFGTHIQGKQSDSTKGRSVRKDKNLIELVPLRIIRSAAV